MASDRGETGLNFGNGIVVRPHMRVGLLGGSFDPPHAGHRHISRMALNRFGLDRVIWLVSPGNPLKENAPAPMGDRLAAARRLLHHPRIDVSDIEVRLGTRYTAETLQALKDLFPRVEFTWLMGADNLAQFHRWKDWQQIMTRVPVGVLARPGQRMAGLGSPAARIFRNSRLHSRQSGALAMGPAPRWCFLNVPMLDISSTRIRDQGHWGRNRVEQRLGKK
ncbi:nicotinate-nucleotide adenylyltransferase [Thalassococcus lentus]|uniref:Probable nicotinate-nucleotide adenylyltransferase n=1 Tax=Thalassococcus lentus TaxID=1210524 RepID=A0ABT4XXD9_9RHOB|nr:nicotinate-nucleotide adenylyltransferase [Thalassococcus lentus]MDA7426500.1 nicotinate-nucleotide adenylyltransferase [Thalassococcus lentus]